MLVSESAFYREEFKTMSGDFREDDVRGTYRFLGHKGWTMLRRIHPSKPYVKTKFVNNEEDFVEFCKNYSGRWEVYVGINDRPEGKGKGQDITSWNAIIIDLDPVRLSGTPSTNEQMKHACQKGKEICKWMEERGFIKPVMNFSGNGVHLYCAVPPLTLTDELRSVLPDKIESFLKEIQGQFEDETLKVDTSLHDLARVIRVVGTANVKSGCKRISRNICGDFVRKEDKPLQNYILSLTKPMTKTLKDIEELKEYLLQKTNLSKIADKLLRKEGGNYCCPFHPDSVSNPNLSIYEHEGKDYFRCFRSGCEAHGDAISLVRQVKRLGYMEALEYLARELGFTIPKELYPSYIRSKARNNADWIRKNLDKDLRKSFSMSVEPVIFLLLQLEKDLLKQTLAEPIIYRAEPAFYASAKHLSKSTSRSSRTIANALKRARYLHLIEKVPYKLLPVETWFRASYYIIP